MKKYHVQNYIKWKEDMKASIARLPKVSNDKLSREQLIIKFLPLVENMAHKFSTIQQASGVLDITDLIQDVDRALMPLLTKRDNINKTAFVIVTADRGLAGSFNSHNFTYLRTVFWSF